MARHCVVAVLVLSCTACVPAEQDAGRGPAAPVRASYATQVEAPAPAYERLIADPPPPSGSTICRDAVAPLPELVASPVSRAAQAGIRTWPASQRRTGAQHDALLGGRVTLRDGCFHVQPPEGPKELAWFHAETGLDIDAEGYYIFVNRFTGETMARVGEDMRWAGPNAVPADAPGLARLRAACGPGEVASVGNPESFERMTTRYPHLRGQSMP